MKIKQLLAGLLLAAFLAACVSACSFSHPAPETTEPSVTAAETTAAPPPPETTEEPTTEDPLAAVGVVEDNSFYPMAMDKAAVLQYYTEVVNDVKNRCPGFLKNEIQDVSDVSAGKGRIQLANRILNLVAVQLLNGGGRSERIRAHDDVQVLNQFPIYGQNYACALTDVSLIESGSGDTNGKVDRLVLRVRPTLNPEPAESPFGQILTPVARKSVAGGISKYFAVLDLDQYTFDFNYTDNEIVCVVDRETGRLVSLTQRMVVKVDIDLDLDLFWFSTNFVEAHGTVVHKVEYSEFDWS